MNRSHSTHHLSDDDLIGLLYGVGDAAGHLDDCSECGERWEEMHRALGRTRAETAGAIEISSRKLAIQRQQVIDRLEQPSFGSWQWIPASAAVAAMAVALFLHRPSTVSQPAPGPVASTEADAALFSDVYSMEQDVEPRATAPIRALFEETSFEPSGEEHR
jgi:hypothetical protein